MKKIILVVGARPNFIKGAPLYRAFAKYQNRVTPLICHTGQHFDKKMSKIFFKELEMPEPDFYLGICRGSHAEQTAKIMIEFEKIAVNEKPDMLIVFGDVNSTMACSLVASKLNIPVSHVEAGLRSFDRKMPEEINRILTDVIADYLFVTERSGLQNLRKEGISDSRIFFTGNIMIDSVVHYMPKIDKSNVLNHLKINKFDYILATFHRPSNVDSKDYVSKLIDLLNILALRKKIVFPIHPRTYKNLERFNLLSKLNENIINTEPIGYINFLALIKNAQLIITDSGGIQEESTYLGIQCITLRDNTERPVTIDIGTNHLIGTDLNRALLVANEILDGNIKTGQIPKFWDGKTSSRITKIILQKI